MSRPRRAGWWLAVWLLLGALVSAALQHSDSVGTCSPGECRVARQFAGRLVSDVRDFHTAERDASHADQSHGAENAITKLLAPRGPASREPSSRCRDARQSRRLLCRLHGRASKWCARSAKTVKSACHSARYSGAEETVHGTLDDKGLDAMFRAAGQLCKTPQLLADSNPDDAPVVFPRCRCCLLMVAPCRSSTARRAVPQQ